MHGHDPAEIHLQTGKPDIGHQNVNMSLRDVRGFGKNFFPKIRDYYGSGWVGPGLNRNFWKIFEK